MTPQDWAAFALSITSLIGAFAIMVRWMVKHYLAELKPNSGSSLKDSVTRLERQIEEIYRILLTGNKP
jgi:hypothetical protein